MELYFHAHIHVNGAVFNKLIEGSNVPYFTWKYLQFLILELGVGHVVTFVFVQTTTDEESFTEKVG
jgi:hypothetical protein